MVTSKNSAICVFFLIRYGDSVVLVTLTAILFLSSVYIEWEVSRLTVSVNLLKFAELLLLTNC